jgi:hypothetical protein
MKHENDTQEIVDISFDDLLLWTENPRDPVDGKTNDEVIIHALNNMKTWRLESLAKSMGDTYDFSELPTVVRVEEGKYRVFDGNRRVILAFLSREGFPKGAKKFRIPSTFPEKIPCNLCTQYRAVKNIIRKHAGGGTWTELARARFLVDYANESPSLLLAVEEALQLRSNFSKYDQNWVSREIFSSARMRELGIKYENGKIYSIYDRDETRKLFIEIADAIQKEKISTRKNRYKIHEVIDFNVRPYNKDDSSLFFDFYASPESNFDNYSDESTQDAGQKEPPLSSKFEKSSDSTGENNQNAAKDALGKKENNQRRTRRTQNKKPLLLGRTLSLEAGEVNDFYRELDFLYELRMQRSAIEKVDPSDATWSFFRMSLRLLIETAGSDLADKGEIERDSKGRALKNYCERFSGEVKGRIPRGDVNIKEFLSSFNISKDTILRHLESGAHNYSSGKSQDIFHAVGVFCGYMLEASHGKREGN